MNKQKNEVLQLPLFNFLQTNELTNKNILFSTNERSNERSASTLAKGLGQQMAFKMK